MQEGHLYNNILSFNPSVCGERCHVCTDMLCMLLPSKKLYINPCMHVTVIIIICTPPPFFKVWLWACYCLYCLLVSHNELSCEP